MKTAFDVAGKLPDAGQSRGVKLTSSVVLVAAEDQRPLNWHQLDPAGFSDQWLYDVNQSLLHFVLYHSHFEKKHAWFPVISLETKINHPSDHFYS